MDLPSKKSSFVNDSGVVDKCKELAFFCSEPGFCSRTKKIKDLTLWAFSIGISTFLCGQKSKILKVASVGLMIQALRPFGEGKYIRFIFGMATVMRALRVVEVLFQPKYFEDRGAHFTIKFCFLYHDLRRATMFQKKEHQLDAERTAIIEMVQSFIALIGSILICRMKILHRKPFFYPFVLSSVSMFRFYFFVTMVEAAYRFHLAKFSIRAPICFDGPWESETISEFWGKRWNLSIAQQLRNIFFKPLAERGYREFGEIMVFISSACLHMIPIITLGGSKQAIQSTALFFLSQPMLILIEKKLKIKSRLWVQTALWGVAPLFAIPMYEVM